MANEPQQDLDRLEREIELVGQKIENKKDEHVEEQKKKEQKQQDYENSQENSQILDQTDQSQANIPLDEKFPPNIADAKIHGQAKRVGLWPDLSKEKKKVEICQCCGYLAEVQKLPYCTKIYDLDFLGPGFPLYFEFLIQCLIILFLMFVIGGIYPLIDNWRTNDCLDYFINPLKANHSLAQQSSSNYTMEDYKADKAAFIKSQPYKLSDEGCSAAFQLKLSLGNKSWHDTKFQVNSWINLANVIVILLYLHFVRWRARKTTFESDRDLISPSDFTIMISKMPQGVTQKEVEDILKEQFWEPKMKYMSDAEKKTGFEIRKINLAYGISDYVELVENKRKLQKKINTIERFVKRRNRYPKKISEQKVQQMKEQLAVLNEDIKQISHHEQEDDMQKRVVGVAFVSFEKSRYQSEIVKKFSAHNIFISIYIHFRQFFGKATPKYCLVYKNVNLHVKRAAEPDDILWENLGYTFSQKLKFRLTTNFATIILLAVCFGIIIGINFGQNSATDKIKGDNTDLSVSQRAGINLISLISAMLIVIINTSLKIAIKQFGQIEKRDTITEKNQTIAEKLCIAQFLNTCMIILVVNIITKNVFGEGGLLSDAFVVFITNAFVATIMSFLDPTYLLRILKRYTLVKSQDDSIITQYEANQLFEGPALEMYVKYAQSIKTMWFTAFYMPLMPIGIVISFAGLIFQYFVDKWLIFYRNARPQLLGAQLNLAMIEYLEFVPLFISAGQLLFHDLGNRNSSTKDLIPNLIAIGLSSINFIFPSENLNRCILRMNEDTDVEASKDSYEMNRIQFFSEYDRTNPVTHSQGLEDWQQYQESFEQNFEKMMQQMQTQDPQGNQQINQDMMNQMFNQMRMQNQNRQYVVQQPQRVNFNNLSGYANMRMQNFQAQNAQRQMQKMQYYNMMRQQQGANRGGMGFFGGGMGGINQMRNPFNNFAMNQFNRQNYLQMVRNQGAMQNYGMNRQFMPIQRGFNPYYNQAVMQQQRMQQPSQFANPMQNNQQQIYPNLNQQNQQQQQFLQQQQMRNQPQGGGIMPTQQQQNSQMMNQQMQQRSQQQQQQFQQQPQFQQKLQQGGMMMNQPQQFPQQVPQNQYGQFGQQANKFVQQPGMVNINQFQAQQQQQQQFRPSGQQQFMPGQQQQFIPGQQQQFIPQNQQQYMQQYQQNQQFQGMQYQGQQFKK